MNKEEIEDIKDDLRTLHKVLWNEHQEGTYTIQRILEYIYYLEQKESVLDKVTDKLKEYLKVIKRDGIYVYDKEINEILNIIEGEKK